MKKKETYRQKPTTKNTQPAAPCSLMKVQTFSTGATRNPDDNKLDYEGVLAPCVLRRYAEYMHSHRTQLDGSIRESDNWQKGIPKKKYMKSLLRHVHDVWAIHRGEVPIDPDTGEVVQIQEALCGAWFNLQGYLFEDMRESVLWGSTLSSQRATKVEPSRS